MGWFSGWGKPAHKFGIGERVRLIDSPAWTNPFTRHLIGREAVIVGFGLGKDFEKVDMQFPELPYYKVVPQDHGEFYCSEPCMKRLDDDSDPFAEPRDIGDDTPNKVVSWETVPGFKPKVPA